VCETVPVTGARLFETSPIPAFASGVRTLETVPVTGWTTFEIVPLASFGSGEITPETVPATDVRVVEAVRVAAFVRGATAVDTVPLATLTTGATGAEVLTGVALETFCVSGAIAFEAACVTDAANVETPVEGVFAGACGARPAGSEVTGNALCEAWATAFETAVGVCATAAEPVPEAGVETA
jgi:hypothetical protein